MSFSDKSQIFALAILLTSMVIGISTKVVTKREIDPNAANDYIVAEKRPFCNAFTGCGKKRSAGGIDSDIAARNAAKKVLEEARMWQLLQRKVNSKKGSDYNNEDVFKLHKIKPVANVCKAFSEPKSKK